MQPFQNNEPLHFPKEPVTISLHVTFSLSYQPFTSLHFAIHIYTSLPLTSLPHAIFHFSNPPFKTYILPWEVSIAPSGSVPVSNGPIAPSGRVFQSVMDLSPLQIACSSQ